MTDKDIDDPALRVRAVQAAQGNEPFDLIIDNVRILDMVTGRERMSEIGIVGPLIAFAGKSDHSMEGLRRIDGQGRFALPGLIDTHMHIESSMITPSEYAAAVVPAGVTTAIWDPHEFANACGVGGVDYATRAVRDLPLRVLTLAPTCVPSAPGFEASGGDFGPDTLTSLLARDDIHGAAELMTMQPLLEGDDRVSGIVDAARASGKRICGHARGLKDGRLHAYAAAGVETDHELTSATDLIARLEAGMTVELRGSHDHLLPEFAQALLDLGHLPQSVTLCTDDVFPDELHASGGLDRLIRRLISLGLPALWVYRAATLNAAWRIGRNDRGLIAPGKRADILLVQDLAACSPDLVLVDGRLAAENGRLLNPVKAALIPADFQRSVRLSTLAPSDFEVMAQAPSVTVKTLSKPRFPVWGKRELAVRDDRIDLPPDMIRMCVANRYGAGTPPRVALLENWGNWRCAFASTVSHDSHNLTIFGRDPDDMALAANAVLEMNGGLAVAQNGKILSSLALPVAGLVSKRGLAEIAEQFRSVRAVMDAHVDWQPPYLVFKALFGASLVCNAGPRLSDVGIVEVFENIILESCVQ